MEADEVVLASLSDLRAGYPAMRVRLEHVLLDGPTTVFRATLTLPTGAEATGYGAAPGTGPAAIARAEQQALARAMTFLGVDPDELMQAGPDDDLVEAGIEPDEGRATTYGASSGLGARAVADEGPTDPFNLGPAPSAAAVAAATGMRLGARDTTPRPGGSRRAAPEEMAETDERSTSRLMTRSGSPSEVRPAVPSTSQVDTRQTTPQADEVEYQDVEGDAGGVAEVNDEATIASSSTSARPRDLGGSVADPVTRSSQDQSDEDASVSHQAFWRWAREQGLDTRQDVEALIGRRIVGLRPGQVRDLIMAAQADEDGAG